MSNLRLQSIESAQNRFLSNSEPARAASAAPAYPTSAPPKSVQDIKDLAARHGELKPPPAIAGQLHAPTSHATTRDGVGVALSDTPAVRSFGMAVGLGITFCFLLSPWTGQHHARRATVPARPKTL
jgi:hypothetical protein